MWTLTQFGLSRNRCLLISGMGSDRSNGDLHLFVAQIIFLITRVKLIQRHFVVINERFYDFRSLVWLEVIWHKMCILTTFGHTSEKRTRIQPWLLDAKDCTNQPSDDGAIEVLEESERGRKMMKLPFRRFFRQTTTTRGGSTAGPPPEHHHMGRRFPRPAAHICMADPTLVTTSHSHTHQPKCLPLHISWDLFSISTHLFQHTPHGHLNGLLEAVPDHPIS